VGFAVTDQLLITFFAFAKYWRKKLEYNETVYQLFVDFKKAYDSVRREVLYSILTQSGVPMKLVRLTKMCLKKYTVKSV
jgi:sorting nexin-29